MRDPLQTFGADHSFLLNLIERALSELAANTGRSPALDQLAGRLRTHLRLEEELVFPAVERLVQDPDFHLTATLRKEHQALRALCAEVEHDRAHDDHAGALGTLRELDAALRTHEHKERRVLYPMAERLLAVATTDPVLVELLKEARQ